MSPEQAQTWRRRIVIALVAIGLLLAAFSAGRLSAPEEIKERTEYRDRVEYRVLDLKTEDIVRGMTFAREVQVWRWRNVVTTITDAGMTITDHTIEHEGTAENSTETETSTKTERTESEGRSEVERVQVKEITVRPRFRISLLAGASIERPWIVLTGPLVLGLQFDVRILGGFSLGAWINTFGAFGGSASLEF